MTLVKTFLKEMGFVYESDEVIKQLFSFLYISFISLRKGEIKDPKRFDLKGTTLEVFENFNEETREKFLADKLCSQLVYFFLANFASIYTEFLSGFFSNKAKIIINELKDMYDGI